MPSKVFTYYEPHTVLAEVNGISLHKTPYQQYGKFVSVYDELPHSNCSIESWLEATYQAGLTAAKESLTDLDTIPVVSQPGFAMAFGDSRVPFVWLVRNNVGFAESAPIPPQSIWRARWKSAFRMTCGIVLEGTHYLGRCRRLLKAANGEERGALVHTVRVPLREDMVNLGQSEFPRNFRYTEPLASVVALPVPWKVGNVVEWMEATQLHFGWVWVTGNASSNLVADVMRRSRIGVHLSAGESLSLVTMEHLLFHPTFVLQSDGYERNFGGYAVAVTSPADLIEKSAHVMESAATWEDQVYRQRSYLYTTRSPGNFRIDMDAAVESIRSVYAQMRS